MGYETVMILSHNNIDRALKDPEFPLMVKAAMGEALSTCKPAHIGIDYGTVMPANHGYDPTLYLSCGGTLKELGTTTVTKLPHTHEEYVQIAKGILDQSD